MPNYDMQCQDCQYEEIMLIKYSDRDKELTCDRCGGTMTRVFRQLNGRTPKTSASFVDGVGRPGKEGKIMAELKKSAALEEEAMKHKPGSKKHKELKREAKERKHFPVK